MAVEFSSHQNCLLSDFATAPEELEQERKRRRISEEAKVKDEPQEMELQTEKAAPIHDLRSPRTHSLEQQQEEEKKQEGKKNSLFYEQPGCVSKLCTFREVNKVLDKETVNPEVQGSPHVKQNGSPVGIPAATVTSSSPTHNTSEPAVAATPSILTTNGTTNATPPASSSLSISCLPVQRESLEDNPLTSSPAPSRQLAFQANDQLKGSPHHPAGLLNCPLSALQVRL